MTTTFLYDTFLFKLLNKLHIVEGCPNCESAAVEYSWVGITHTHCVVCGDKEGKITGWVWGKVIDPFCWLGQRNVARCLDLLQQRKQK